MRRSGTLPSGRDSGEGDAVETDLPGVGVGVTVETPISGRELLFMPLHPNPGFRRAGISTREPRLLARFPLVLCWRDVKPRASE